MSIINLASANVAHDHVVTLNDVAAKAGVSIHTAKSCMYAKNCRNAEATKAKVLAAAAELGYNGRAVQQMNAKRVAALKLGTHKKTPANPVFASRIAETNAMLQLRKSGHSDKEVAHRCGVCPGTVIKRIGRQPAEITAANKKLAGQVRSAKAKIKKAYQQKQTILEYNALADKLNAQLLEVQKLQSQLLSKQKAAQSASKATKAKLVEIVFPNAKVS